MVGRGEGEPLMKHQVFEYATFPNATVQCDLCGWFGLGKDMKAGEIYERGGLSEYHCPQCGGNGDYLALVSWPKVSPPQETFKKIVDRLDEPIHKEGEPCVHKKMPYILYGMWDCAEDWSGEYVREVHPFFLIGAPKLSTSEFWTLVRKVHRISE